MKWAWGHKTDGSNRFKTSLIVRLLCKSYHTAYDILCCTMTVTRAPSLCYSQFTFHLNHIGVALKHKSPRKYLYQSFTTYSITTFTTIVPLYDAKYREADRGKEFYNYIWVRVRKRDKTGFFYFFILFYLYGTFITNKLNVLFTARQHIKKS